MKKYKNRKMNLFLYILGIISMIFIFSITIYKEKYDRKNEFKILIGAVYDESPSAADIVLNRSFELKNNKTKNGIFNQKKTDKKLTKKADKAAFSLGYTDKAYEILFDEDFFGIKRFELEDGILFVLAVFIVWLGIYLEKRKIIAAIKRISEKISVAINENGKFEKSDGELFYLLESDIENLIDMRINLNNYIYKREEQMQKFMENIAHQIKTPLARIILNLDMLVSDLDEHHVDSMCRNKDSNDKEKNDIENKRKRLIEDSLNSCEEIKKHVLMLLNLARMEAGKVHFRKDIVELTSIFQKIFDRFGEKNISTNINFMDEIYIRGDENWLFEAISNIIDNSLVHGKSQKPIEISVREFEADVRVSITDYGKGLNEDEILKIFDRYYTGDETDTYSTGIGMNLARYVIRAHYSDIRIKNNEKTGLTIEFNLPKPELKQKICTI